MELVRVPAAQDPRVHPDEAKTFRINLEERRPLACHPHSPAEVVQIHQGLAAAEGGSLKLFRCRPQEEVIHRSYSGRPLRRYIVWRRGLARSTAPNQRS
jgi:hypothetical protein